MVLKVAFVQRDHLFEASRELVAAGQVVRGDFFDQDKETVEQVGEALGDFEFGLVVDECAYAGGVVLDWLRRATY